MCVCVCVCVCARVCHFFICSKREKKVKISKGIGLLRDVCFLKNYLFRSYIRISFQLVAYVGQHLVIYKFSFLCFDIARGIINGGPNETRTHSDFVSVCI